MTEVKRDEFLTWYRFQAVDAARLRQSGAPHANELAAADVNANGEIGSEAQDELALLFDRIAALDPQSRAAAFDTERAGQKTPAGRAYDLVTIHMRQKSGGEEPALGARLLSEVPSLAAIFEARQGAKLRRVDGRATLGTGPMQDALNEIAAADEARHGAGYRSPFRVDFGNYRGYFGAATETAVRAFQASRPGLVQDGIVGRSTLRALEGALVDARRGGVPHDPPPGGDYHLSASRFQSSNIFARIASGAATLARGSPDRAAVETLQLSLFSLGFDIGPAWVDRDFGGSTAAGLSAFQREAGVAETGVLDRDTLIALDRRVSAQLETLRQATKPLGGKAQRYRLQVDIAPNRTQRIYVIDRGTEQPVARYLTSPGRAGYETHGDHFTIRRALPRSTWYPPDSDWARNLHPVGPGIDNPMGILKLDLGQYAQYIHGMPKSEIPELGRPASHGCLRMSPSNILHLFENYAEPGTDVRINRDANESVRLDAAANAAGVREESITQGREYLAGYVSGELGHQQGLQNGQPVLVG